MVKGHVAGAAQTNPIRPVSKVFAAYVRPVVLLTIGTLAVFAVPWFSESPPHPCVKSFVGNCSTSPVRIVGTLRSRFPLVRCRHLCANIWRPDVVTSAHFSHLHSFDNIPKRIPSTSPGNAARTRPSSTTPKGERPRYFIIRRLFSFVDATTNVTLLSRHSTNGSVKIALSARLEAQRFELSVAMVSWQFVLEKCE